MGEHQVTITLSAEILQSAELWAQRTGQSIDVFLSQAIELSLAPLCPTQSEESMSSWSDHEVVEAFSIEMSPEADRRLSELLHRQQAGTLLDSERGELQTLMASYQRGLLTKALALKEGVRRGIMESPQP